jgi:glutamine amidotransferase
VSPPSPRIAIVDYGAGNLRSVQKALLRSGVEARVTGDPSAVAKADGVVLPGAGAFREAIMNLEARGLADAVRESVAAGRPYLGLCLGLQLLFEEGEEHGLTAGLGVLKGRVERFPERGSDGKPLRIPHIGWNTVRFEGEHPMLEKLPVEDAFYFVHSYRAVPSDASVTVGTAHYGERFTAAAARGNVFAVQFHPEKSQRAGRRLLDAYAQWAAS